MNNTTSINERNLKELFDAFEHYFPSDAVYTSDKPFKSFYGDYTWGNRKEFIDFIKRLTGIEIKNEKDIANIKLAQNKLVNMSNREDEEKTVDSNESDKWTREAQEEERKNREAEIKKSKEEAAKQVEESIKTKQNSFERQQQYKKIKEEFEKRIEKQQEIQTKLEGKKVYAKVVPPEPEEASDSTKQFIEQAKNFPQSFKKDFSSKIEDQISNSEFGKNLSKDEARLIADKVTNDTLTAISNPVKQVEDDYQVAILQSVSKNNIISKTVDDKSIQYFLNQASDEVSFNKNQTLLSRNILSSFNENLASNVFGPDPQKINVLFFTRQESGVTHTIDLQQLNSGYGDLLNTQSQLFNQIGSLGKDELQSFLLGQARTFLDGQMAKLPADSLISSLYNSSFGQQVLNFVGLTKYTPLTGSPLVSFLQQIPGSAPVFEWIGSTFGINFATGVGTVVPAAEITGAAVATTEGAIIAGGSVAATTGVVATQAGAALATGAVAGASGVAAGATAGAVAATTTAASAAGSGFLAGLIGGPVAIITAAIGAIIGLIKAFWPKIKEFFKTYGVGIVGFFAILGGGLFGSPLVMFAGVPLLAASAWARALMKAVLAYMFFKLSKTVIITLACIPIVVALFLLIINSGAYVVPPTAGVGGHYGSHDCSVGVKIVEKAENINKNLQLGFNSYYNKSLDYPELWNAELFATNPNPENQNAVIDMDDMFWCNYTPIKSYLAISEQIPFGLTPMMNYFIQQGKWTSGAVATINDICPGDTIFFRTPAGTSWLSHVAVVSSVNEDGIITVQSNSPWKHNDYATDSSGHFPIFGSGNATIEIVGFGAP